MSKQISPEDLETFASAVSGAVEECRVREVIKGWIFIPGSNTF